MQYKNNVSWMFSRAELSNYHLQNEINNITLAQLRMQIENAKLSEFLMEFGMERRDNSARGTHRGLGAGLF